VIDQDTGHGISDAVVVGRYVKGSGPNGSESCNRIESTISNSSGYFQLPRDDRSGVMVAIGYARGYVRGNAIRHALQPDPSFPSRWQVAILKWSADNRSSQLQRLEEQVYPNEQLALEASGEIRDVYMRRSALKPADRLQELDDALSEGSCAGPSHVSDGAVPFYAAILQEQLEINPRYVGLTRTRDFLEMAKAARLRDR
jgi:hypothetical protein